MCATKTKTVCLLGAGFSKPAGMPLATELTGALLASNEWPDDMREWLDSLSQRVAWLENGGKGQAALNI
jgi:hypothetical protein